MVGGPADRRPTVGRRRRARPAGEIDYGFRLDDDPTVRPDPRSRRQPDGVDGLTRTFDPSSYQWGDAAWTGRRLAGSLIYELHIGTFTPEGTLDAADRQARPPGRRSASTWWSCCRSTGSTAPTTGATTACCGSPCRRATAGRGPTSGSSTPATSAGIAVIQDVVYNHLGKAGNYLPRVRPVPQRRRAAEHLGRIDQPGRPRVRRGAPVHPGQRRHVAAATTTSTGCGWTRCTRWSTATPCTCWRRSRSRWTRWPPHVRRPLTLIAESDLNDPKLITPREAGGYGLTAQWNDDFHHVIHVALTGETDGYYADFGPMSAIAKVLTEAFFHDGTFSSFRGRDHGRPVDTLRTPSWRFIGYSQDHDQIGNRAAGDRLTAHAVRRRPGHRRGAGADRPVHPDAVHGRGMGGVHAVGVLHLAPRRVAGRGHPARAGWRSSPGWAGTRTWSPTRRRESTFTDSKLDWRGAADRRARPDAAAVPGSGRSCGGPAPSSPTPGSAATVVDFDDDERWLLIDRSGLRIAVNLSDDDPVDPAGRAGRVAAAGHPGRRRDGRRHPVAAGAHRGCHRAGRGMSGALYTLTAYHVL